MSGFRCENLSAGNPYSNIEENILDFQVDSVNREIKLETLTDDNETERYSNLDNKTEPNSSIIYYVYMDVKEPFFVLRLLLQEFINYNLDDFRICIQDDYPLDENRSLVDQCLTYEGPVQVLCKVCSPIEQIIKVIDVIEPALDLKFTKPPNEVLINVGEDRWLMDESFSKFLEEPGFPLDPTQWNINGVRHWLMWAVFHLNIDIDLSKWILKGNELLSINVGELKDRVNNDPFGNFWTHIQLFFNHQVITFEKTHLEKENVSSPCEENTFNFEKICQISHKAARAITQQCEFIFEYDDYNYNNLSYGPIMLWQFLLEILTDRRLVNAIQWLEDEGEFKILEPELVAHLWGLKKKKPNMNYEKLCRALRYYYDGDLLCKVAGQKFVYKFVCNLEQLIGYSATSLRALVTQAASKSK